MMARGSEERAYDRVSRVAVYVSDGAVRPVYSGKIHSFRARMSRLCTPQCPASLQRQVPLPQDLSTQGDSHQCNEDHCSVRTDNWVPASLLRASLNADTRPAAASSIVVSFSTASHEQEVKPNRFPDPSQSSADVRAQHSSLSAVTSTQVAGL